MRPTKSRSRFTVLTKATARATGRPLTFALAAAACHSAAVTSLRPMAKALPSVTVCAGPSHLLPLSANARRWRRA